MNGTSSWGETALQGASSFSNGLETVRLLLARGADVNVANRGGWTALMEAALIGQTEIIHALLAHRSNLTARNADGQTACMIAAQYQHADVERTLVETDAFSLGG